MDVHKKRLAVVVADVEGSGEYPLERRKFYTTTEALRELAEWRNQQAVEEVVMESTAQYWRPVWGMLEQCWQPVREQRPGSVRRLHLAQAKSNVGRRGRKNDFPDAERLVQRLVARELVLSFVPCPCPTVGANRQPAAESVDGANSAAAESTGESAASGPWEAVERGVGPVRGEFAPYADGAE